MHDGTVCFGGKANRVARFISPTIIDEINLEYPIMQEETYGTLFPVVIFSKIEEMVSYVNRNEKPPAFYYLGKKAVRKKQSEKLLQEEDV